MADEARGDVGVGLDLPSVTKHPTTRQLVKWAAVTQDFYEIHYDRDFAQSLGLPGVIVHGPLACSFLGQLVTNWIGARGKLRRLSCSYKGMIFPGEDITCRGRVTGEHRQDGQKLIECEVWLENQGGIRVTEGQAVVALNRPGQ